MTIARPIAIAFVFAVSLAASESYAQAAKPAPTRSKIHDIVILKDGSGINGEVKVATFTLKTKYGPLPIPKGDILMIEYKKLPNTPEDEVQISAGTRLKGDLLPTPVKVNVDGLGDLDIPKSDILAIILQRPIEGVSEATRRALKR